MPHKYQDLIHLFNDTFSKKYNTFLVKGDDEPLYLPANQKRNFHQIIFARGFYASAFHEIAHWCQAGIERRKLEDFGYWYIPENRDEQQQIKFEQAEIYPQAIEWAFNIAAQRRFNVSSDNLDGFQTDSQAFKMKVYQQVIIFIEKGFPARAQEFIEVVACFYGTKLPLSIDLFELEPHLKKDIG